MSLRGKEEASIKQLKLYINEKLKNIPKFYSILKVDKILKDNAIVSNTDYIKITDLRCNGIIHFSMTIAFQGHMGINQEFKYNNSN